MDLLKNLRTKPPTYEDAVAAADYIERLHEALRLERKLRDASLSLANAYREELERMNGHTWSVAAALKERKPK